jgi:hypothetical protein
MTFGLITDHKGLSRRLTGKARQKPSGSGGKVVAHVQISRERSSPSS